MSSNVASNFWNHSLIWYVSTLRLQINAQQVVINIRARRCHKINSYTVQNTVPKIVFLHLEIILYQWNQQHLIHSSFFQIALNLSILAPNLSILSQNLPILAPNLPILVLNLPLLAKICLKPNVFYIVDWQLVIWKVALKIVFFL